MEEGKEYCFSEYLFGKQYALIKYKCPILDGRLRNAMARLTTVNFKFFNKKLSPDHNFGIITKIYNPNNEFFREVTFSEPEGNYEFQSIENLDGNYEICFRTNTSHGWYSTAMIVNSIYF